MKSLFSLSKLFGGFILFFVCVTNTQAQLDHNMIFRVHSPSVVAGDYAFGSPALDAGNPATQWGPSSINTVTGDLEWIDDNLDSLGCDPATNNLAGKIALIRRGDCMFSLKAYHAQQAGAIGCIICNNDPAGGIVGMLGGDSMSAVTIPSIFIAYNDCELLRAQIDAGTTTNASFYVPSVYDVTSSYAYNTPIQHVQPLSNMSATIYNGAANAVNNVNVTATIVEPGGGQAVLSETVATLPATSDSVVTFTGTYTPTALGVYDVVFKSSLNPNDSVVQMFQVNGDSTFRLDNNNFTPSGNLSGIGPSDADFAAPDAAGTTYLYEMGATYLTGPAGPHTASDATSASFALSNANLFVNEPFYFFLYEEPAGGFLGTEQDYGTFNLIGGGFYIVQPSDTLAPHTLMNAPLLEINNGLDTVPLAADKQYMLVLRYAGDGSITTAPRISYTHIQDYLSLASTVYTDRLYMAGWNPSYAPVIRLHVQPMVQFTGIDNKNLANNEATVFPVPTNNLVNVKLNLQEVSENVTIKLVDLNGRALKTFNYNNVKDATYAYNVEDLAGGVYLMHIQTDSKQTMRKVIIK